MRAHCGFDFIYHVNLKIIIYNRIKLKNMNAHSYRTL